MAWDGKGKEGNAKDLSSSLSSSSIINHQSQEPASYVAITEQGGGQSSDQPRQSLAGDLRFFFSFYQVLIQCFHQWARWSIDFSCTNEKMRIKNDTMENHCYAHVSEAFGEKYELNKSSVIFWAVTLT